MSKPQLQYAWQIKETKENGIKEFLEKSTIRKVENTSGEFLSNMILVKKKDGETVQW